MIVTAPTKLTTERYIRLKQYQDELVHVALAQLGTTGSDVPAEVLAQWAADDIVPAALFWLVNEDAVLPVLRGTYAAINRPTQTSAPRHSAEERLIMMIYDAHKLADRRPFHGDA